MEDLAPIIIGYMFELAGSERERKQNERGLVADTTVAELFQVACGVSRDPQAAKSGSYLITGIRDRWRPHDIDDE